MTVSETPSLFQKLVHDLRANLKIADTALADVREDARSGGTAVSDDVAATLRQLRADIGHVLAELDASTTDQRESYVAEARRRLDAGRGVLDEMWVRSSLGRKELQDQTGKLLQAAENAWLAACSRLSEVQKDVSRSADDTRTDLSDTLHGFNTALADARAAFTRAIGA